MALDEPKEQDKTFEVRDWTFLMDPEMESAASQGGGVYVDFVEDGFRRGYTVQMLNSNAGDCGSCGGGCG